MAVSHRVSIEAPKEEVFAYATDPSKMGDWLPNVVAIHNIVGSGEGQQYEWTYKLAGLLFHGESVVVEYAPPDYAIHQTIGAVNSTWDLRVTSEQNGAQLSVHVEYEVPLPVLGKLAERVIASRDARVLRLALENVKEALEP